jgi:hypothetical protein
MSCERFRSKINSRGFDIAGVEEREEWENENVKQDAFSGTDVVREIPLDT